MIVFSVMDASHRDRTSGAEAMCGVGCGHTTGGTIGGKVHELLVACSDPATQRREAEVELRGVDEAALSTA